MSQTGPTRDLGPCQVLFGGTDLGATDGGVKFTYGEEDTPIHEDQEGTSTVDDVITGYKCQVEVPLTRMGLSSLSALISGATGSGTALASGKMTVKSSVGQSRYATAKELILKPLVNGVPSTDAKEWLHVYKAAPQPNFELGYGATGQRTYKFAFKGYADKSGTGAKNRIWGIGA